MRSITLKLLILGTGRDQSTDNFLTRSNRTTISRLKSTRAIPGTAEYIETKTVEAQERAVAEIIMRQKDTDQLGGLYCFEHATPPDVIVAVFDASSRLSFEGVEEALRVLKGMKIGCGFWVVADMFWEAYGARTGSGDEWDDVQMPSVAAGVAEGRALAERFCCGFSAISSESDSDVDGVVFDVILGWKGIKSRKEI
ncbi:hypothetical protein BDW69DRAFT_188685 [Aspergillus filifer]